MRRKPEIKKLVEWLKKEGNSSAKMAMAMGYKSSNTIEKWISNNKIPARSRETALSIIGEQSVNTQSSN